MIGYFVIDVRSQHKHVVILKAHLQLTFAFSNKGNRDLYLTTTCIMCGCLTLTIPNSHHELKLTVAAMQRKTERKKKKCFDQNTWVMYKGSLVHRGFFGKQCGCPKPRKHFIVFQRLVLVSLWCNLNILVPSHSSCDRDRLFGPKQAAVFSENSHFTTWGSWNESFM